MPPQPFHHPNPPTIIGLGVNDAPAEEVAVKQRLGLIEVEAVDNPVGFGIDRRSNRFRKIRVLSQNQ